MRTFDRYSTLEAALRNPEARNLLERSIPDVLASPLATGLKTAPLGGFLAFTLAPDTEKADALLEALAAIPDTSPIAPETDPIVPDMGFETDDVPHAGARISLPANARQNSTVELVFTGPSHGNPFVDVEFGATLECASATLHVGGFYDGDGRFVLRFLPELAGEWRFTTQSNARSLDGITGALVVAPGTGRGAVKVKDTFQFGYANGEPFVPFGTTSYAWTHQDDELQDLTVQSLAAAPFNKIRMALFPKAYIYNTNEPQNFVFPRRPDGGWDTERFDLEYFHRLERRLRQLDELGIEADLILFHPYDRWGFSDLGKSADERYLRYIVRRLAGLPNVWWSMANEYDLLTTKRPEDWDRLARVVRSEDHADHLLSIHNWVEVFDYSADWVTHASIQRNDFEMGKRVDEWHHRWGKPVIVDEFGYEGDLDQGWGNLTGEEVVDRFWGGVLRGGYVTHGETFYSEDEVIWWSKGGRLRGESVERIAFLRQIVAASPTGRIAPLASDWDVVTGGMKDEYVLIYFGMHRPRFRDVTIPEGMRARIDVIDAWRMTVDEVPGVHEGIQRVRLPARPMVAVRLRAVHPDDES